MGERERDHWLTHMRAAVEAVAPSPEVVEILMGYFEPAADAMRNDGLRNLRGS